VATLPQRSLGTSGIQVSVFALGSWRTYERISREAGVALLDQARESGFNLLEVARYNDESGKAPIPTGYSEVVFGELFRRSGWPRHEVTIGSKLWWELWPEQTARQELESGLERTGLDHFDYVYSDPPPESLPLEKVVAAIGELITSGELRAWGIANWPAEQISDACEIARDQGVPPPCAAQLPYSLAMRKWVESQEMTQALRSCGASVVASYTLTGGILSGKYADGEGGRMAGELEDPRFEGAVAIVDRLRRLARELDTTPATLAMAFALSNPSVATVLFGATSPEQLLENVRAAELAEALDEDQLARLRAIDGGG
jgi:aryl-alcohol dehydrogenase-like predicted oxidoreductase